MGGKSSYEKTPATSADNKPIIRTENKAIDKKHVIQVLHNLYEHQHRYCQLLMGLNIDDICKRASDNELARAFRENYELMLAEDSFMPKYLYTSNPASDMVLSPSEIYVGYKMARFTFNGRLIPGIAVLLTLYIPSSKTHIRRGNTGELIQPVDYGLNPLMEYCTGRAIVSGVQFIGDYDTVLEVVKQYSEGAGKIISNFDPRFEYKLGYDITEPEFGTRGIGCIKGIHFFTGKQSTLKYSKRGFFAGHVITPVISGVISEGRNVDDPDMVILAKNAIGNNIKVEEKKQTPSMMQLRSSSQRLSSNQEQNQTSNQPSAPPNDIVMTDITINDTIYPDLKRYKAQDSEGYGGDIVMIDNTNNDEKKTLQASDIRTVTVTDSLWGRTNHIHAYIQNIRNPEPVNHDDVNRLAKDLFGTWYTSHNFPIVS